MKSLGITLLLVLLGATMLYAQYTRQAAIDFINHTSATVRFSVDGNAACSGDIIPNGTCTEYVNAPATHRLCASASGYEPICHTVDVDPGDHKVWTVGDAQ